MADQFQIDSKAPPSQPSRLVDDLLQLFGEDFDPDSQFLEESWLFGTAAALQNLQRRRRTQAEREQQNRAFREFGSIGAAFFVEQHGRAMEFFLADRAATIASHYDPTWSQQHPQQYETPQADRPCDDAMPLARARLLLEVAPDSTREQVRSAYRRMVTRWHPDRLQLCTDEIRSYATQQMADLNQAYCLICASLQKQAA
jgi:DnaJ-domain-containing protein 1